MAEQPCLRSLGDTLIAAASTSALFIAANWGLAVFIDLQPAATSRLQGSLQAFFLRLLPAFACPLAPLLYSLTNAIQVRGVKRSLEQQIDRDSIAIITLCPIYIQFPKSALAESGDALAESGEALPVSDEALAEHLRHYRQVLDSEELQNVCPLELRPSSAAAGAMTTKAMANTHVQNNVLQAIQKKLMSILSNSEAQLTSIMSNTESAHVQDSTDDQLICLQLPDTYDYSKEAAVERATLLGLSLAPSYTKLSFLRSRSKFQTVVVALQAGGYMLTVVQRVSQNLTVNPVEAITTFLCIIIGLQLLIELYACGHFRRPLLLRLTAHQFRCFRDAPRKNIAFQRRYFLIVASLVYLIIWFLSSFYFKYYMLHACRICSLPVLLALFYLSQPVLLIFRSLRAFARSRPIWDGVFVSVMVCSTRVCW